MKALVIVHLSSLDAYAEKAGLEEAFALADRLKEAILGWDGPVYVIDQRWPRGASSEPRWNLVTDVQLRREIRWSHFRDDHDDWNLFMKHFRSELLRAGVKEVVLGGVWYYAGGGCVADIQQVLKRNLRVTVDKDLVGCWPSAA
jgi:hypothetical protein